MSSLLLACVDGGMEETKEEGREDVDNDDDEEEDGVLMMEGSDISGVCKAARQQAERVLLTPKSVPLGSVHHEYSSNE